MRQNMKRRISSDQRGKIKTGIKVKKENKEYPQSLDYFYVNAFPELLDAYGEKPDKLIIVFPSNNIDEFFNTEYNLWASKGGSHVKKRYCDSVECTHYISEEIGGQKYSPGEISPCLCFDEDGNKTDIENKLRCKSYTSIKAFIIHPQKGTIISPTCYLFETHSDNSSNNIYTEIDKIWHMTGGLLTKIPFVLSVNMVESTVAENGESEKRKYPIWHLQAFGTTEQIIEFSNRPMLPTTEKTKIELAEETPQIEAPKEETISPYTQSVIRARLKGVAELLKQDGITTPGAFFERYGGTATLKDVPVNKLKDMVEMLDRYENLVLEKEAEKAGQQAII